MDEKIDIDLSLNFNFKNSFGEVKVIDEYDRYMFDHVFPIMNFYFGMRSSYKDTGLLIDLVKLIGKLLLYCPDN